MKEIKQEAQPQVKVWGRRLHIGELVFEHEGGVVPEPGCVPPLNPHTALSKLPDDNPLTVTRDGLQIEFGRVECCAAVHVQLIEALKGAIPFVSLAWASGETQALEKAMPVRTELADVVAVEDYIDLRKANDEIAIACEFEFTFHDGEIEVWRAVEHIDQTVRDAMRLRSAPVAKSELEIGKDVHRIFREAGFQVWEDKTQVEIRNGVADIKITMALEQGRAGNTARARARGEAA